MATPAMQHEVDDLREIMRELAKQSLQTEMSVNQLSRDIRALTEDSRAFKDEMTVFKDEMTAFKDEMREFKEESRAHREEIERDRKRMNKQWGDLANKMGTIVEDIVAPNLPRVAAELLGCAQPELFAIRLVRHFAGETREYDAMVVCADAVLVNETKSNLLPQHVEPFLAKLRELPEIFPDYAGRRVVGVLASLGVEAGVVNLASRHGIAVMAMGDETMDVLNPEAVTGRSP